jgi:hypothetical protein
MNAESVQRAEPRSTASVPAAKPAVTISQAVDAARALDRARAAVLNLSKQRATVADLKVLRSAAAWLGSVIASAGKTL